MAPHKAVVVGATNGIGKACALKLAGSGFHVIAVGRDRPGRAEAIIAELNENSPDSSQGKHSFYPCDAFSLQDVKKCAEQIVKDHDSIDAAIMTQGMATLQSFTPTVDGNDEKMTLHYWSRMAFANCLLPSLRKSTVPGSPCVISVLSGGVHSPYKKYMSDPLLKKNYSIQNAADCAGYYTDLGFDYMARQPNNQSIQFIHAAPGVVNSNWGTEFPWYLRYMVRGMQSVLAKSPKKCAKYMCDPIMKSVSDTAVTKDKEKGIFIMNQDATEGKLTKAHTNEAMEKVWNVTAEVLQKVGIDINKS